MLKFASIDGDIVYYVNPRQVCFVMADLSVDPDGVADEHDECRIFFNDGKYLTVKSRADEAQLRIWKVL